MKAEHFYHFKKVGAHGAPVRICRFAKMPCAVAELSQALQPRSHLLSLASLSRPRRSAQFFTPAAAATFIAKADAQMEKALDAMVGELEAGDDDDVEEEGDDDDDYPIIDWTDDVPWKGEKVETKKKAATKKK